MKRSALLVGVLLLGWAPAVCAQAQAPDLGLATLEELMKVQITSAGRKQQRADDVPAAVFVITSEDIRRSGIRTLPELFRLAPGVQVSQINASHWAVSIRGFNDQFSNKLLVLIDGRSIYKHAFSGVLWDAEDLVLDDIDRIEIVRGPGGAVWGANAVNGVINIVTKAAKDTQGGLVRMGLGTLNGAQGTARYGGMLGGAAYRVYSQWSDRAGTTLSDLTPAKDEWSTVTGGGRLDWSRGADQLTLDGSVRSADTHPLWRSVDSPSPADPGHTDVPGWYRSGTGVARWTRQSVAGATLQVQSAATISRRFDLIHEKENIFEVDAQFHTLPHRSHDVVAGGGYRLVDNATGENFQLAFTPASSRTAVVNLFVQDEIAIRHRVWLTLGSKLEHDTVALWTVQPTARVLWRPAERHRLWAAVARAVRTPSGSDLGVRFNFAVIPGELAPIVIGAVGNPDYETEKLLDVEAGYRFELGSFTLDATTFRGRYTGLPTNEPLPPVFETTPGPPHVFVGTMFANYLQAVATGLEIAAHVAASERWRIDGSYTALRIVPHVDPASQDAGAAAFDGNAAGHQWQLHSSWRLGSRAELDTSIFRVGRLKVLEVPAYTRADVRGELRLAGRLSLAVAGRNLFDQHHAEALGRQSLVMPTLVPRAADVQLVWKF